MNSTDFQGTGEQFAELPTGVTVCFETFGMSADPAVLLIMGLGGPMGWWDAEFCQLVAARGYFVIRYDNRDTGRSTHLSDYPVSKADVVRTALGFKKGPYSMSDLSADAAALLDHLDIDRAHVVGVSMGGMIAQTLAIAAPHRVASLVSIMSTTGQRAVGWQHPKLLPNLLSSAKPNREAYAERVIKGSVLIGSPAYPTSREATVKRAHETYDRGWSATSTLRQMMAILTQPDRTEELRKLQVPAAVIHGLSDLLVNISGGRATARAIPNAELVEIAGMGHDLPRALWGTLIDVIDRTARRGRKDHRSQPGEARR